MQTTIKTKYGNASIDDSGYYRIHSNEKGNRGKKLHRVIFENFYGHEIPKGYHIHHKNGDRLDNCILNLQMLSSKEHSSIHKPSEETKEKMRKAKLGKPGIPHTEETKRKIRDANKGENSYWYGKKMSEETKRKISETKTGVSESKEHRMNISAKLSSTGIYRVTKEPQKNAKQGFYWKYRYEDENGKTKSMYSNNLEKLKKRVLDKGLEWIEFGDDANESCNI